MSDFDKFFSEKLNEEVEFPRQDKNWRNLSRRLDAFATGATGSVRYLRYWQAAAAVLLILTAGLAQQLQQARLENKAMQQQIAASRATDRRNEPADGPALSGPASTALNIPARPGPVSGTGTAGGRVDPPLAGSDKDPVAQAPRQSGPPDDRQPAGPVQSSTSTAKSKSYTENTLPEILPGIGQQNTAAPTPAEATPNRERPAPIEAFALLDKRPAGVRINAANANLPELRPLALPLEVARSIIRPLQHQSNKRFRAGIQVVAGTPLPRNDGISWFTGAGIGLEYTPLRNLWVTASAEQVGYSVCVRDSIPPKHHFPPEPPQHGHHKPKLVQIDGNPTQQCFSLGMRYALPVRFPLRPSIRLAHTWVRTAPGVFSFQYDDKPGPGPGPGPGHDPEFVARTAEPNWFGNNWRLGLGLEYETSGLVFGIGADYAGSLASKSPVFDAFVSRASVQFKF